MMMMMMMMMIPEKAQTSLPQETALGWQAGTGARREKGHRVERR
jgi:hypothetical protein